MSKRKSRAKPVVVKFGMETKNMTPDDSYFLYYNPYKNDNKQRDWKAKEVVIAVETQPFEDSLTFIGFKRANHSTRALLISSITGIGYAMNEQELACAIKVGAFTGDSMNGVFTFKSRGGYSTLAFLTYFASETTTCYPFTNETWDKAVKENNNAEETD